MKRILLFTLFLSLSFFSNAQSITVTQPNGGEILYACQTYLIKWNASGTSNFYDIDYSLNNGSIWASVASNINITNGQYSWTVPNVESNTCLIRVRDKNDTTKKDISDAVFTIHIPVVVTSPNGGEVWQGGSNQLITWNIQGTSLTFNLDYSADGGSTWNTIVSNLSTSVGTYNWTVANNPSTNCLVRVRDAVTNCMQDQSNNVFTITPAQPVLTYPNGGEAFYWDQPITITWTAATFYSNVRLEYSVDNGVTWILITAGASNSGSYSGWNIPQKTSGQVLIKASNSANVSSNDVSNAVFTILKPITVTTPNGGESLLGCNSYNVTISKTPYTSGVIYLQYSTDGGANWNSLTAFSNTAQTSYTYNWTVPNGISSSQCLVRAYNNSYPLMADTSNAFFTIQPNNVITVTAPNGGQILPALSNYVITWTNTAGASGLYDIFYFNGTTNIQLASGISGNSYNWTNIPNVPSSNYTVTVSDYSNSCKTDVSDAPFTVTAAQPVLTYPNGGESFYWDQPITITWTAASFYSNVRLEYSVDNGVTWILITAGASNSGSYSGWNIPQKTSGQVLIKASNSANVSSNDVSNAVFTIMKPLTVTTPNGGESLLGCNSYSVTISKTPYTSGVIYLQYSTDGGANWNSLTAFSNTAQTSYTYNWTVPNGITSSQCLVRAYNNSYPLMADTSNAFFTIQPNNVITVTAPNGGQILAALSNYVITWTNTAGASGLYDIFYFNGTTNIQLASGISGNSYNWTNIPNVPSSNYTVTVSDYSNSCKTDVSDAPFTVTAAQPVLTYPNGGEAFYWDQPITITWTAASFYSNVRLEYSVDNGVTWILITAGASNSGTYSGWNIPQKTSGQVLIKASNTANLNSNDVSNAVFTILKPLTVTTPNGGESLLGCNSYPVTISKTPYTSGVIYLQYSTDGGANWNSLTAFSNTAQTSYTYNWTVPNGISSTQCLVRAYNNSYPLMADTSNAFFTIQPNNVITVTAPNGGQILPALSNYVITWTNTAGASGLYDIFYFNGTTNIQLASGISGNTYNWTNIPNVPNNNYTVTVSDNANSCKTDVSDAPFTVTAAQPVLTFPNGGESFYWDQPITITWTAASFYSNVRLEYSVDNGVTWILITAGASNSGSYSGWNIPQKTSGQVLIKASNTANLNSNDVSNAVFTIMKPLTVTTPNGGESLLGCNSYPVTISKTPYTSGVIYLQYSTDGGTNWNSLTAFSNTAQTSYTYNWTVPNGISSTQCLVRAYNNSYPLVTDTGNAFFTIQPNNVITVTAPNGGQILPALSNYVITWTNTAGASGLYDVFYFNGTTNIQLASGISGNTYNWTNIPNVPNSNYTVTVSDNANSCKTDVSDAPFTVTAAQPVLTYPNGGESFFWDQPITITWTAASFYSNVRLEYSVDNGVTWILITAGASNSGSYSGWNIPQKTSGQVLIKASNTANLNSNDVSNAVFTIMKPLTVTTPNGGESLLGCNSYPVTISKTPYTSGVIYLQYSTDGGANWNSLTAFSNTAQTSYTYNWTVPNGISSSQCLVRAYNNSYPFMADTSNAFFTIQPNNVITVTAPNGGQIIPALSNYVITWTNTAGVSGLYDVFYFNGTTNIQLASGITGNSYNWTNIPNIPNSNYTVTVSDYSNSCKSDVSDAPFTVTAAQPVLTFPNGGEQLWSGSSYNITWNTVTFYSNVRLEYSLDNGNTWLLITSATSNNGSYNWTLPNLNSTNCLVKASNTANLFSFDISNAVFTIKPAVKLFTPNGLEQLGACTQTSITFEHAPAYTGFNIEYSIDNGTSWTTLATNQFYSGTTGSYNWTIPNLPTLKALVKVTPFGASSFFDISDANFIIKPAVTMVQPNFGGLLQVATVYPIKWSSDGISNLYDLAYSTSGSSGPWTNIVVGYNTATNTYNWTVPNIPSTNCYIRVRDNAASCKEDVSNLPFIISTTSSPITVVNSNGGDTLSGCQNYAVSWTESAAPIGSYNIDLSVNGGISWSSIVSNYVTTSGLYNWVVPNINTDQALIRVSSSSVSTIYDVSNIAFVIKTTSVKASPDTVICSGAAVNLIASGGVGNYSWSPSNYLNNPSIPNPVATPTASINYILSSTNGTCVIKDTATITVQQLPSFSITKDALTNICGNQQVTFTANVVNGGVNPSYQWKLNNQNVGNNANVYAVSTLKTGDSVYCLLSYNPTCFSTLKSNTIGITISPKPNLGNDTIVTVSCTGCTYNLNSLYNLSGYVYVNWNTTNPAVAAPGVYRLVVSQLAGCTCPDSDTLFVTVNALNGLTAQTCINGSTTFLSNVIGATYQWQVDNGTGYVNIGGNSNASGITARQLFINDLQTAVYGFRYRCLVDGSVYSDEFTIKFSNYWTGAANTDWENPGNWGCGSVPDKNTDVFIYGGKTNYPEVNCNRVCRSIYAAPSTSLKVTGNKLLYLIGK